MSLVRLHPAPIRLKGPRPWEERVRILARANEGRAAAKKRGVTSGSGSPLWGPVWSGLSFRPRRLVARLLRSGLGARIDPWAGGVLTKQLVRPSPHFCAVRTRARARGLNEEPRCGARNPSATLPSPLTTRPFNSAPIASRNLWHKQEPTCRKGPDRGSSLRVRAFARNRSGRRIS